MLRNQATALLKYEHLTTTVPKANRKAAPQSAARRRNSPNLIRAAERSIQRSIDGICIQAFTE